ncbi:hypothetical protein Ahy_B10g102590 [Arachis hypogaea]|uniref:Uncharacterized protein n=1 Tax=Arachis hypogaea TaxID=3818 RepID=A0A444X211_ARAHY|nr:hypothetical protein Ahy_B10g102590 [Arachis hypogaea]
MNRMNLRKFFKCLERVLVLFNSKYDFKEVVREFTIQEGRHTRFKKNDRKRVRLVYKVNECKWGFINDHTCPTEDKNRTTNRNWVASKLVKKVKKYPNFRSCDATTFFKTKYNLLLNWNSISMSLSDARNVVYGDEKAQYTLYWTDLRHHGDERRRDEKVTTTRHSSLQLRFEFVVQVHRCGLSLPLFAHRRGSSQPFTVLASWFEFAIHCRGSSSLFTVPLSQFEYAVRCPLPSRFEFTVLRTSLS